MDAKNRIKNGRTPFASAPTPDPREVVDALMDPERRTLQVKKEEVRRAE